MIYGFAYHRHIPKDLKKISPEDRLRVQRAIETKLSTQPDIFGKPLGKSLTGCWSLRVSDIRVVYRIKGTVVSIECIGYRKTVYSETEKRL